MKSKSSIPVKAKAGYKKTKLGWIPENWELRKLIEVASDIMGRWLFRKNVEVPLKIGLSFLSPISPRYEISVWIFRIDQHNGPEIKSFKTRKLINQLGRVENGKGLNGLSRSKNMTV